MRQQIEVTVKMTFDVDANIDAEGAKQDIGYWVSETMQTMDDINGSYEFMESKVVSIQEEAEIYSPRDLDKNIMLEKTKAWKR